MSESKPENGKQHERKSFPLKEYVSYEYVDLGVSIKWLADSEDGIIYLNKRYYTIGFADQKE